MRSQTRLWTYGRRDDALWVAVELSGADRVFPLVDAARGLAEALASSGQLLPNRDGWNGECSEKTGRRSVH